MTPTEPRVMSEVDRLRLENATLRLVNASTQETMIHLQLKTAADTRVQATKVLEEMKQVLFNKYGFDPTRHSVQEDGTIVDRPASSELAALLGKIGQASQGEKR